MQSPPLELLSDRVSEAHANIQKNFDNINPVVGVNRKLRGTGIPADLMTIDCLKTGKRIIIILHDDQASKVQYQFSYKKEDPGNEFQMIELNELTSAKLYQWMAEYFDVTD